MPNKDKYPELDPEEVEAIRAEMEKDAANIDRFFLLKLQSLFLLCLFFSALMLLYPQHVTFWLQVNQGVNPDQVDNILTYRAIFVFSYVVVAIFSWQKGRYTELVFGSATIMAITNFLLDFPYLWAALESPNSAGYAYGILVRIFIISLLISIFRNLERASYLQGKLFTNPFAPLKR